ncbi:hypothetical protein [Gluconacetobacter diazotrophicus]|uniref:Uncharacterized protein n=1 Tax=Gluconacetobacter diazotrophicus TaxID=33996 RepID=A0A7W4I5Q4_GLUDI|nr:hypothetical protein [Gluconacetobacter diazotrophicus]MBB2156755.1 hypothetical protein [Gluconacetobacter diazotrophicus]
MTTTFADGNSDIFPVLPAAVGPDQVGSAQSGEDGALGRVMAPVPGWCIFFCFPVWGDGSIGDAGVGETCSRCIFRPVGSFSDGGTPAGAPVGPVWPVDGVPGFEVVGGIGLRDVVPGCDDTSGCAPAGPAHHADATKPTSAIRAREVTRDMEAS